MARQGILPTVAPVKPYTLLADTWGREGAGGVGAGRREGGGVRKGRRQGNGARAFTLTGGGRARSPPSHSCPSRTTLWACLPGCLDACPAARLAGWLVRAVLPLPPTPPPHTATHAPTLSASCLPSSTARLKGSDSAFRSALALAGAGKGGGSVCGGGRMRAEWRWGSVACVGGGGGEGGEGRVYRRQVCVPGDALWAAPLGRKPMHVHTCMARPAAAEGGIRMAQPPHPTPTPARPRRTGRRASGRCPPVPPPRHHHHHPHPSAHLLRAASSSSRISGSTPLSRPPRTNQSPLGLCSRSSGGTLDSLEEQQQ